MDAMATLRRRIELLVALPKDKLEHLEAAHAVREIAERTP
jgi:hypothetical protein